MPARVLAYRLKDAVGRMRPHVAGGTVSIPLVSLFAVVACTSADPAGDGDGAVDGGAVDGGGTDGGGADGGGSDGGGTDGGSDGGAADGGTGDDGGVEDYATGIVLVKQDDDFFAEWGASWLELEVGPDFESPFLTPDGGAPRFNVLWPTAPKAGVPHPVVMLLHGSSTDVDDEVPEGDLGRCTREFAQGEAQSILERSIFVRLALDAGFVVLSPENAFCDGWAGLGPRDPHDTLHAGYFLEEVALGWLRSGQGHLAIDTGAIYIVGTSLGAAGAPVALDQDPEIAGLVFDSGPADYIRYTVDPDYSGVDLEARQGRSVHVIGGLPYEADGVTPSEFHDRYLGHSLEPGLAAGRITRPVFWLYNEQDPLVGGEVNENAEAVLAAALDPLGVRWTAHDVDHADPVHTQLHKPQVPYAALGVLRFVQGHRVAYVEAEDQEGTTWVGTTVDGAEGYTSASGQGVRIATRVSGAGTLVTLPLPDEAIGPVSATVFMQISGAGDTSQPAATLSLRSSSDGLVDSRNLAQRSAAWSQSSASDLLATAAQTTLEGELTSPGQVIVTVTGEAVVVVDVMTVSF